MQDAHEPALKPARPNRSHVLAIASKSYCDPRTVERWMMGGNVRRLASERLAKAAKELKIEVVR
jgi:hypothetical protein